MLHVYILNVSSPSVAFKCFSCHKCFIFQRYIQRVIGARPGRQGIERGEPGALGPGNGVRGTLGAVNGERGAARAVDGAGWGQHVPRMWTAVRCGKAGASCSYQTGSCGPYHTGGELRQDALLGSDVSAFVLIKRKRE
jgi:hypothetical protein